MAIIANYDFTTGSEEPQTDSAVAIWSADEEPIDTGIISYGATMPIPGPDNPGQSGSASGQGQIFPQHL
jgi:hypothetical protein